MAPAQQERREAFLAVEPAPAPAAQAAQAPGHRSPRSFLWVAAGLSALLLAGLAGAAVAVACQGPGGPRPSARALLRPDRQAPLARFGSGSEPDPVEILQLQLRQATDSAQKLALHTSAGHLLRDQGRYGQAAGHYRAALGVSKTSSELIQAQHLLGLAELQRGRLYEARQHLEVALVLAGEEGDLSSTVFAVLADVRREMGHVDEALKLYGKAWTIARGRKELDALVLVAAEISEAHARKGEVAEALRWLERANQQLDANKLDRGMSRSGDPAAIAKVDSYMAGLQHAGGHIARARELYRKALREQAAVLHPSHPDILATRMGMARAQRDDGDLDRALQSIDAVAKTLASGPNEGPDQARTLILRADLLREASRFEEAERDIREALRLQKLVFGGQDHPEVAVALSTYGSILHDMGKIQAAHDQYREALRHNLRTVGQMHPETASTYNSLGTLFEDAGQDEAAEMHFTKCLEIQLRTVGESSPDVANTYNNLATVIFRRGEPGEAAEMLRKAIAVLDAAGVPKGNPDRTVYEENLEEVLHPTRGRGRKEKGRSRSEKTREEAEEEMDTDPVFMLQKKMEVTMQKLAA